MRLAAAAALALAALAPTTAASSTPRPPAHNGAYAFTSELRSSEAYIADADGGNVRRLTNDPGLTRWPALSPDGSQVAFASKRDGWWDIYVMNIDGTNPQRITHTPGFDGYPDWSPDGQKLAFSGMFGQDLHVFVYDFATQTQLDITPDNADAMHPRWSPDGSEIAYDGTRYGTSSGIDLYVVSPSGTDRRALTAAQGWERQPAWSPDGTQIAYTSYPNGHADVFVINADGSHPRDLTLTANTEEYEPAWSSAGIAFRSNRGGRDEIYLMQPNGSNVAKMLTSSIEDGDPNWSRDGRQLVFDSGRDSTSGIGIQTQDQVYRTLTQGKWFDTDPAWSPGGTTIAFSRSRTVGHNDLYLVNPNNGTTGRLTHLPGMSWAPAWSPDGRQIAFDHFESFGGQIWLIDANGKNPHPLTSNGPWNVDPSWSPDGHRIVYSSRQSGTDALYILDLRTHRSHRLTHDRYRDATPAWSPDGKLIAYTSSAGVIDDIYVIRPDGTGKRQLTKDFANSEAPTWSPDGTTILYEQDDFFAGDGSVHSIGLDGQPGHQISNYDWSTLTPSWQPIP